ncbi:MAG: S8 family serine peptidase [Saprospiraceae bacterium]|nr:S8 family serine peptidase [Saprospiraceae bacterium]
MKKILLFSLLSVFTIFIGKAQQLDHVMGEVMVQLEPGASIRQLAARMEKLKGVPTKVQVVRELSRPVRIWLLSFDFTAIDENEFLATIKRQPEAAEAQFNHILQFRATEPNDPNFSQQWQWVNTGQGGGTVDADVDADLAWDITTGGKTASGDDIVVCVVEGCNRNHPDLQGNLWFNNDEIPNNGLDDDGNGYVDDYKGWNIGTDNDQVNSEDHGTTVSGMIGAKGNNSLMVTGINWDVKIMHVDFAGVSEANSIEAYTYPLIMRKRYNESGGTAGAFVVATNSSWGTDNGQPSSAPLWCAFYDSLGAAGILSCGSTANNNVNIDVVGDLPTACPSEFMISVTATNNKDIRTFSAYGIENVDVGAPGENVLSLGLNGTTTQSGTSFASPLTAGIIGLLYSAPCISLGPDAISEPAATALKVRDALFAGVDVVPNLVGKVKYGGRVNAYNSLLLLLANCGPCPKPYGINISDVTETQANIVWGSTDSTLLTNFRWRVLGDTTWIEIDSASSPVVLANLATCTEYEFQLEDFCTDTTSGFTPSFYFKTDGCCEPPSGVNIANITENSAVASWNPVLAANAYNVQLTTPQGNLLFENLVNTSFAFTDLEPCTEYIVHVQTVCDTGTTNFGLPVQFLTMGCGACLDKTYCTSNSSDAAEEWIENVTLNTLNNTSGSDGGYGDYSGFSTDLLTYNQYDISLTPGFSAIPYNERWAVWIDYNQDGVFNNINERAFSSSSATSATVNGSFVVPGSALPGLTRMRVTMRYNQSPNSPCTNDYGEVEDYCINIGEGTMPDCGVPSNFDTTEVKYDNATLVWDEIADAQGYDVRFRKNGASNWSVVTAPTNQVQLLSIDPCTEFECQVRSTCIGVQGAWSASLLFTTDCVNALAEKTQAPISLIVRPNPFSSALWVDVEIAQSQEVRMQLLDACGKVLFEKTSFVTNGKHTFGISEKGAVSAWPDGIYFLKVVVGENCLVKKVIRQ